MSKTRCWRGAWKLRVLLFTVSSKGVMDLEFLFFFDIVLKKATRLNNIFSFFKRTALSCIEILGFYWKATLMRKSNFKATCHLLDFFMRNINLSLCGFAHNQRVFYRFIIFFCLSGFFNSFEVNWNPNFVTKVKRCLQLANESAELEEEIATENVWSFWSNKKSIYSFFNVKLVT